MSLARTPVTRARSADVTGQNRERRLTFLLRLMVLSLIALYLRVIYLIVIEYGSYFPANFESAFLEGRREFFFGWYSVVFYVHIMTGPVALCMALFLMASGLRARYLKLHVRVGQILVLLVGLVVAPSGLAMAWHAHTGPIAGTGFASLAIATIFSAWKTMQTARRRKFAAHRTWAIRFFILLCSPLILRLMSGVVIISDLESDFTYQLSAWTSWIVPIAFFESWRCLMTKRSQSRQSRNRAREFKPVFRSVTRRGLTLIELLVVIAVIAILAGMLVPATRTVGDVARRTDCANRMRQITLSMHSFHDSHDRFPSVMDDPLIRETFRGSASEQYSGLMLVFPYLELDKDWALLKSQVVLNEVPSVLNSGFKPWREDYPDFTCPTAKRSKGKFGQIDFGFSIGDMARSIHKPVSLRGAFAPGYSAHLQSDFPDGTSRTMLMAEINGYSARGIKGNYAVGQPEALLDNPADVLMLVNPERQREYASGIQLGIPTRGGRWADGSAAMSMVNTILPPGSPSAALGWNSRSDGFYSATANHPAGINIALVDGSVRNIARDIDAGDTRQPVPTLDELRQPELPTNYGVWGELGGRADGGVPLAF